MDPDDKRLCEIAADTALDPRNSEGFAFVVLRDKSQVLFVADWKMVEGAANNPNEDPGQLQPMIRADERTAYPFRWTDPIPDRKGIITLHHMDEFRD